MVDQSLLTTRVAVFQLQFASSHSSIGAGKLPMIVKLVLVNPDILAMISGGIMRMNRLWVRFMFCFSSDHSFRAWL
jgi:hypothetical protein